MFDRNHKVSDEIIKIKFEDFKLFSSNILMDMVQTENTKKISNDNTMSALNAKICIIRSN